MAAVHGNFERGFEPLVTLLGELLEPAPGEERVEGVRPGAALAVYVDGRPVIDVWAGTADTRLPEAASAPLWEEDTTAVIFSCTKGLVSILLAQLVEQGLLDYDAPVAQYWPEFGAHGKDRVTVREALGHRAGLSSVRVELSMDQVLNWDFMVGLLSDQEPLWAPGQGYVYHSVTHGWITGELIRRVTGKSPETVFSEVFGALSPEIWLGLPASEETRVARIGTSPAYLEGVQAWLSLPNPLAAHGAELGGALPPELVTHDGGANDPRFHAAVFPAAGGIATARALAKIWSATVTDTDGVRLLGPDVVRDATRIVSSGPLELDIPGDGDTFGAGFELPSPDRHFLLSPQSFGHNGAGGQMTFADPGYRVGFGFITNYMQPGAPIADALAAKLKEILDARG